MTNKEYIPVTYTFAWCNNDPSVYDVAKRDYRILRRLSVVLFIFYFLVSPLVFMYAPKGHGLVWVLTGGLITSFLVIFIQGVRYLRFYISGKIIKIHTVNEVNTQCHFLAVAGLAAAAWVIGTFGILISFGYTWFLENIFNESIQLLLLAHGIFSVILPAIAFYSYNKRKKNQQLYALEYELSREHNNDSVRVHRDY